MRPPPAIMALVSATLPRSESNLLSASPPARRTRRASWRDPRLAVGLVLVAGSVVAGATLISDDDRTTEVLTLRTGMAVGTVLEADDLVPVAVGFSSEADAERYLPASGQVPAGAVLLRPVGAGELVPRDAVGPADRVDTVDVPVPVSPERMATGVRSGALVDVWVSPDEKDGAELLLEAVPVRSVGRPGAGAALRQVVVAVPQSRHDVVSRFVARLDPQRVLVVLRRG